MKDGCLNNIYSINEPSGLNISQKSHLYLDSIKTERWSIASIVQFQLLALGLYKNPCKNFVDDNQMVKQIA